MTTPASTVYWHHHMVATSHFPDVCLSIYRGEEAFDHFVRELTHECELCNNNDAFEDPELYFLVESDERLDCNGYANLPGLKGFP